MKDLGYSLLMIAAIVGAMAIPLFLIEVYAWMRGHYEVFRAAWTRRRLARQMGWARGWDRVDG